MTVMAWSVILFCRTAANTPMKIATKMAMTVAMITMRRVTKRCDIISDATSCPLIVVPRLPWRAPVNQIQYRCQRGSLRWSRFSLATIVECGMWGLLFSRARGSPELVTRRKTKIVAKNSTTMLIKQAPSDVGEHGRSLGGRGTAGRGRPRRPTPPSRSGARG